MTAAPAFAATLFAPAVVDELEKSLMNYSYLHILLVFVPNSNLAFLVFLFFLETFDSFPLSSGS